MNEFYNIELKVNGEIVRAKKLNNEDITTMLYYMDTLRALEKVKEIKSYIEIAFHDSEVNDEPITKKDLNYIYDMIIKGGF